MVSFRRIALIAAIATTGCFRLDKDDLAAAKDKDGDGALSDEYGGDDCNDDDPDIGPHATEMCDSVDNDCDGQKDEGDAADAVEWFFDGDGDGQGNPADSVFSCSALEDRVEVAGDCDDLNPAVFEGATEVCNTIDDNCDGSIDEDDAAPGRWYLDSDTDGFGDPEVWDDACDMPAGYVDNDDDCDDTSDAIHPDAVERCGGADEDCDGETDEDDAVDAETWTEDADGDGYGTNSPDGVITACEAPSNYVDSAGDCDDGDSTIYPGAEEFCDGVDTDCDGRLDFDIEVPADQPTIQAAIDAAASGQRICVSPGTYTEQLDIARDVVIHGVDRDTTIVHGDGGRVLSVAGVSAATVVRSLTLTGGAGGTGAAVYTSAAAATFEDILITGNTGTSGGQCLGSIVHTTGAVQPTWYNLDIIDNTVVCGEAWGVFLVRDGNSTLYNLRMLDNVVQAGGTSYGMLVSLYGDVSVVNGVIAGNRVQSASGGVVHVRGMVSAAVQGQPSLENVTIHGNEVDSGGGSISGLFFWEDDFTAVLLNVSMSSLAVTDTTITASVSARSGNQSHTNVYDMPSPRYGGTDPAGVLGNITVDPLFMDTSGTDPTAWDFRLDTGSGLIDAGDSSLTDPDGSTSDIGAYGGPGAADW